VSDCEELGWIIYRRWWSWFRRIQQYHHLLYYKGIVDVTWKKWIWI